ncbi:MAG: pirin family protein [Bacteroidota bacterium]
MAKSVFHSADTRGHANHGWLDAHHSFSFAGYQDRNRMSFGVLRVLNDDKIAGGMGFGSHPHDNMEIITIPLEGQLLHKDNMGNNGEVILPGDVQVMSAGTGVVHSEYNNGKTDLKLLQIWLFPNKQNVSPRYGQVSLNVADRVNKFQQILSPNENDEGVWIHQDAWFFLGKFDKNKRETYTIKRPGNGVYAFVISGSATINGQALNTRDAYGIWETDKFDITINDDNTEILLMDVPMELPF